jgi:hypothetical protein
MNTRSNLAGYGLIGVVIAMLFARGVRDLSPPSQLPLRDTNAARASLGNNRGTDLIRQYLGREPRFDSLDVEIIIATVPDPYDSRLDQVHDFYLESLRRAFEADGYVLDRFWMPGRTDSVTVPAAPFALDSIRRPTREWWPGVLLFRRDTKADASGRQQIGLLYLVGELPTSGVHKEALRAALRERHFLASGSADANTIRIVGPSFSGSSISLREVLTGFMRGSCKAVIVSGAATSTANARILRGNGIDFRATVHDDATMRRVLQKRILENLELKRVAYLHESTTTYGESFSSLKPDAHGGANGAPTTKGKPLTPSKKTTLYIPFPLNISTVRSEFARNPPRNEQTQLKRSGSLDRLPLQLQDAADPKESPAVVSALTAPTLELLLDEIIETLRANEIQAVGLVATDVRDKLFLGEMIRKRLPDVLLFTFQSDALYQRRDYGRSLGGMVVLSTYPLWPENQRWTVRDSTNGHNRRQSVQLFVSDGAQGVYNATAIQLQAPDKLVEYKLPLIADSIPQNHAPPVWITAVGRQSIQPLAACPVRVSGPNSSNYLAGPDGRSAQNPPEFDKDCTPLKNPKRALDEHDISFLGWAGSFAMAVLLALAITSYISMVSRSREPVSLIMHARLWTWAVLARLSHRFDDALEGQKRNIARHRRMRKRSILDALPTRLDPEPLWVQSHLYAALQLVALMGMFMPVAAVMAIGGERFRGEQGQGHLAMSIAVGLIALTVLAAVIGQLMRLRWSLLAPAVVVSLMFVAHAGVPGFDWDTLILWTSIVVITVFWIGAIAYALASCAAYLIRRVRSALTGIKVWPPATLLRCLKSALKEAKKRPIDDWRTWLAEVCLRLLVLIVGAGYMHFTVKFVMSLWRLGRDGDFAFIEFFHRSIRMDSGHSPLLPLVLAGGGLAAWATWHIRRVNLLLDTTPYERGLTEDDNFEISNQQAEWNTAPAHRPMHAATARVAKCTAEVRTRLFFLIPNGRAWVLFACLFGLLLWIWQQRAHTTEHIALGAPGGNAFDNLLFTTVAATFGVTIWSIYRVLSIWDGLESVLRAVADTPLLSAFERLPRRMAGFSKPTLWGRAEPANTVAVTQAMQWRHLQRVYTDFEQDLSSQVTASSRKQDDLDAPELLHRLMTTKSEWGGAPAVDRRAEEARGQDVAALHRIMQLLWDAEPTKREIEVQILATGRSAAAPDRPEMRNTSDEFRRRFTQPTGIWLKVAEEFAAVQAVNYIEWVQQHLRTVCYFVFIAMLSTTTLLSSYPFQPQSMVRMLFMFVVVAAVASILFVMTSMNRNEVLSKINKTKPGEIEWDATFISNLALYIVVPLLTLLSAQFPQLGEVLFAWVNPLMNSLTKL